MLRVTWFAQPNLLVTGLNVQGCNLALFWKLPDMEDIPTWLNSHRYGEDTTKPSMGGVEIEDDNTIFWGPSVLPDNWCEQHSISGELSLDLSYSELKRNLKVDDEGNYYLEGSGLYNRTYLFDGYLRSSYGLGWGWSYVYSGTPEGVELTTYYRDQGQDLYRVTYTWQIGGYRRHTYHRSLYWGWEESYDDWISYQDNGYTSCHTGGGPINPSFYRDRYNNMCAYVRQYFDAHVASRIKYANDEWYAALSAADGFQPYDLNLVEAGLQFSLEDVVPRGTSETVLDILTKAVKSRGGLASPRGIVSLAKIFANTYLYYKYVASGDYSDISQILLGSDKAFVGDVVTDIVKSDPDYVPVSENWRLKFIAERIVHGGSKDVTTYGGTPTESHTNVLGEMHSRVNARLRARPKYIDDMSKASYVCDQFGLTLTAERLVQVVPYEFIAEWFLPIEETLHSIENNASVLNARYKVSNLCLSRKDVIKLDMKYLLAMFGLSRADGQLYFKRYLRHSQMEFPPTALDLSLHPEVTSSRVLQGSSLIISKLH